MAAPLSVHLNLVCNSHLDPVWLWDWEEGMAAAIATFRAAADICEEYPDFVFNQNEALLYEWVEAHDPALFRRVRKLVKQGRWHIMGGWFLQPDCNLPSGEGLVRQVEYGRRYFWKKFRQRPSTAANLDSFGHSRGLVQILRKSGFDSYLFCRPRPDDPGLALPANDVRWMGFDGSTVHARRAQSHYHSLRGQAVAHIESHLKANPGAPIDLILWGVGNHGGGPSRVDVDAIAAYHERNVQRGIRHSSPEVYFNSRRRHVYGFPVWREDLNPWAVGCYTSQVRVKQEYRRLENDLFLTEKLCTYAQLAGADRYPGAQLTAIERDLLLAQFHDILPGSGTPTVETSALRLLAHAAEELARLRRRPLFAIADSFGPAKPDEVPIFVFNPHPYPLRIQIDYEVQMPDQNWSNDWHMAEIFSAAGRRLPAQIEKEESNLNLDWRKRVVWLADLAPSGVSRFDCRFRRAPRKATAHRILSGRERIKAPGVRFTLDAATGEITGLSGGRSAVRSAFRPTVFADSGDPWSSNSDRIGAQNGSFHLLSGGQAAKFAGLDAPRVRPVRLIEEGAVRSVIESLWGYRRSAICQRITVPKAGSYLDVHYRVHWHEHAHALKIGITLPGTITDLVGQTVFGRQSLCCGGQEVTAQRWVLAKAAGKSTVGVLSDSAYGYSVSGSTLWVTLLRSPYYAALPINDRPLIRCPQFTPVVDQGVRDFRLRLLLDNGGLEDGIEHLAQAWNEAPLAYSYYPSPAAPKASTQSAVRISDHRVQLVSARVTEPAQTVRVRLFSSSHRAISSTVAVPRLKLSKRFRFGPFEVKTIDVDLKRRCMVAVPMA